jgi:hypothetical protein
LADRKATAAKKAVERLAEGRGQDAPSTDAPPNLYVLASTWHRAYQQQAEADKRDLEERFLEAAEERDRTVTELQEHLEYLAEAEEQCKTKLLDYEEKLEQAAVAEKDCKSSSPRVRTMRRPNESC